MKKYALKLSAFLLAAAAVTACERWTEPEARDFTQHPSDQYYADLRAYKASEHSIAFGWFGGWNPVEATTATSLMGIPDSVDLVASWSSFSLTPEQMAEAVRVKELKGTDVVVTMLLTNIGAKATPEEVTAGVEDRWEQVRLMRHYWGWTDDADAATIETAIRKYANALVDEVLKYGYTGLDLDYEPNLGSYHNGNIVINEGKQGDIYAGTMSAQRTTWFIDECSKRLGPKSGTGKLLIVDGLVAQLPKETGDCFDYYILQTYGNTSYSSLDGSLKRVVDHFDGFLDEETITRRTIVTVNMEGESNWQTGGGGFVLPDNTRTNRLEGMASWEPSNGFRKGGFGAYQMQNDFKNDCYKFYRAAIRAMTELMHKVPEAPEEEQ